MLKALVLATLAFSFTLNAQTKTKVKRTRTVSSSDSETRATLPRKPFTIAGEKVLASPMLGIALFDMPGLDGAESDQGTSVGVLFEIGSSRPTIFQTGISYLEAGARGSRNNREDTIRMDYLAFHAVAKRYLQTRGSGLYVKGGGLPMIKLQSQSESETSGGVKSHFEINDTRKHDYMLQVGAGYSVPFRKGLAYGGELTLNRGLFHVFTNGSSKAVNQGWLASAYVTL